MNKIPMPGEAEKQAAIRCIIEKAQVRPKCFTADMLHMVSSMGFRNIFAGLSEIIFLAVAAAIIAVFMVIPLVSKYMYSAVFLLSPLLYIFIFYITFFKEWSGNTWQVTAVCKITLRHLTAVRMVLFGAASLIVNTVITVVFCFVQGETAGLLQLLNVSYCSVLLFALLIMVSLPRKRLAAFGAPVILWSLLAIAATTGGVVNRFLQRLPFLAVLGILAVLLFLFGFCVRNYYYGKGEKTHAFGR